ncbi:hypothetical protein BBP40_005454 [Aspergillus hancockii]|nr:hypothetical protein BBP40_005454 [Aspergillus hancockii]
MKGHGFYNGVEDHELEEDKIDELKDLLRDEYLMRLNGTIRHDASIKVKMPIWWRDFVTTTKNKSLSSLICKQGVLKSFACGIGSHNLKGFPKLKAHFWTGLGEDEDFGILQECFDVTAQ